MNQVAAPLSNVLIDGASLSDRAYRALKEAIVALRIPPGAPLVERSLAEQLGISKTPIRTALARLEREGLVVMPPYRRAQAAPISPQDIREVFEIRLSLECLAIGKATLRLDEAGIVEARRLLEMADASLAKGELAEFYAFNQRFHRYLVGASGNRRLVVLLEQLEDQFRRIRQWAAPWWDEHVGQLQTSHWGILAAIEGRDVLEVERLIHEEFRTFSSFVLGEPL